MSSPPPPSYSSPQPYTTLRLAHHPASAPTATPVIILSLHRPASRNAFTDTMADELVHALTLLGRDRRVRVIVLAASREGKAFCAGADLKSGRRGGKLAGRPEDHRDSFVPTPLSAPSPRRGQANAEKNQKEAAASPSPSTTSPNPSSRPYTRTPSASG
jgi:Enoyl-CoA hydratase/isomerase